MDQKYEFAAPQYVDFNNLMNNDDSKVEEFFNVDMESGEEWVSTTANNAIRTDLNEAMQLDEPSIAKALPPAPSLLTNLSNPNPSLNQPRKPPSNMVTSWGPGPVTRIFRGCNNPPIPTQVKRKVSHAHGKVGRADLHATVQAVLGKTKSTPKSHPTTPRRPGVWNKARVFACTPKRLGTNSQAPRLSVSRLKSQVQRSLNSPSASRVRRKSKSPAAAVPIHHPTTPDVFKRFKNRLLGDDLHQVPSVQGQPRSLIQPGAKAKYKSQAERILTFQHSTPSRFRSRPPFPPKSALAVSSRQIPPAPCSRQLGASSKTSKPREASHTTKGVASKKATIVESLSNDSAKYNRLKVSNGFRNPSSQDVVKSSVTIPAPFHFTTQVRAEERDIFENMIRKKETAAEEKKRLDEEKKRKEDKVELLKVRKNLVHKPEPVRYFKPLVIKKSEKPPTNPVTPQLGVKRNFLHKI